MVNFYVSFLNQEWARSTPSGTTTTLARSHHRDALNLKAIPQSNLRVKVVPLSLKREGRGQRQVFIRTLLPPHVHCLQIQSLDGEVSQCFCTWLSSFAWASKASDLLGHPLCLVRLQEQLYMQTFARPLGRAVLRGGTGHTGPQRPVPDRVLLLFLVGHFMDLW